MIQGYNKINHPIFKFHKNIISVFNNIFHYDLEVYDENKLIPKDFLEIVRASKARLEDPLKEIVLKYHELPGFAKIQLKDALVVNNDILSLSDDKKYLIKYNCLHSLVCEDLKIFFTNLWEKYPFVIQLEKDFGTVKSHYDAVINQPGKEVFVCPFCGLQPFEPPSGDYREAYDHFLAKADYPFISVNFNLLFPTCQKCNSNQKKSDDVLYHDDGRRRKMYNPYNPKIKADDLDITIKPKSNYNTLNLSTLLKSIDWDIEIKRNGNFEEELVTWDEVYGIKGRYFRTVRFLETTWFGFIVNDYKDSIEDGITFKRFKEKQLKKAKATITTDANGITRFLYYNHIFNLDNIESKLNSTALKK